MNLFQKINELKKIIKAFGKDASTTGYGSYSYTSGSQILSAIKDKMEELELLFIPIDATHRGWTTFNYTVSSGAEKTDFVVDGELTYCWINATNPDERLPIKWEYYGQQNDISKAFGSALTYSERYLLLKSLGVPTDDEDPDRVNADKKSKSRTQSTSAAGSSYGGHSKYKQIMDAAESAGKGQKDVSAWIKGKMGSDIKVNDLPDDIFKELLDKLKSLGGNI